MSNISTHVLDSVPGKPGAGIAVRLEKFAGGGWIEISTNGGAAERAHDAPGDWIEVAAGVTDAGLNAQVTLFGWPLHENEIAELNPPTGATVIVAVPL